MSGPKSADYYLTPEQRRQLAEQRRINELKKKIEKYSSCVVYSQSEIDEYSSHADEVFKLASIDNGYSELQKQFGFIISELKASLESSKILNDSSSLSECMENIKKLKKQKESVLSNMKTADMQNMSMLKKEYDHQLEEVMNTDFSSIKSKSQVEFDELLMRIINQLDEVRSIPNLSEKLCIEADSAKKRIKDFGDISMLRNFNAVTIEPLIKRCREYSELYSEFEELYIEYQSLCEIDNIKPQTFECCQEGIDKLKVMNEEMRIIAAKADEQEYISKTIDEVMIEMGYDLIGDRTVTKRSGRQFHSELFTFSEGTAVNITRSSNGQITMELAGLDYSDRQPTDDESDVLCAEMESFCGAFSEFEKRLAKKGVISKHISILPPTSEYAQIINLNDYELSGNADYTELKANKKTGTEKAKRME